MGKNTAKRESYSGTVESYEELYGAMMVAVESDTQYGLSGIRVKPRGEMVFKKGDRVEITWGTRYAISLLINGRESLGDFEVLGLTTSVPL